MCDNNTEKTKKYTKTRSSFDGLGANEKAAFLVESAIQMVVEGVRQAGDAVADVLKNVTAEFGNGDEDTSSEDASKDEKTEAKPAANGKKKKKAGAKKATKEEPESAD
ncbi:MAG: hypothetical protein E2O84_04080 [Bacteroidetes bacterium]|nr:MAG: hypothetical protein E2O84_04080 [Bacteroidota bacterium]